MDKEEKGVPQSRSCAIVMCANVRGTLLQKNHAIQDSR